MIRTTELVELSPWDSDFWGVRAARVTASNPFELEEADRVCRELEVRWSSMLVASDDLATTNAAVRRGYDVVDVRCTLSTRLTGNATSNVPTLARMDEVDALAALARQSLRYSRFFADPHLSDERCQDFYEAWVRNSFTGGMADAVVVARGDDGDVDGFITVRLHPDGAASLPLVAVRATSQGRGVGRALLASTLEWAASNGADRIDVVTQLANLPAMRLYEASGFALRESALWLHRWFDAATADVTEQG